MCGLLIALVLIGAVFAALLCICVCVLFRILSRIDDTARRLICIAISKGEDHEEIP